MKVVIRSAVIVAALAVCGLVAMAAKAEPFKSPKECINGKRVVDRQGRQGTVVRLANDNLCAVKIDDSGKEEYFIFWMLTESGKSPLTEVKLIPGTYECFASGQYTFMDIDVTSPDSYRSGGGTGKLRIESGNKVVFVNGPLASYTSRLDAGPSILLSTNGGSFYGTSCELKK